MLNTHNNVLIDGVSMPKQLIKQQSPYIVGTFLLALFSFTMLTDIAGMNMYQISETRANAYLKARPATSTKPTQPGAINSKPTLCSDVYTPVCGEDGNTYPNECYAGRRSVNVACDGVCPCGDLDDDTRTLDLPEPVNYNTPTTDPVTIDNVEL